MLKHHSRWRISMSAHFLRTIFLILSGPGALMGLRFFILFSIYSAKILSGLWIGPG